MAQLQLLRFSDMSVMAPELTLIITTVILVILELLMPKHRDRNILGWLAVLGIIISAVFVALNLNMAAPTSLLNDSYRSDDFSNVFKLIFLAGTGLILFMSLGDANNKEIPHKGEFYYLFLPAVVGAMIMASSGDLITLFVGLELLSITSYIMVGMRKNNLQSNESAFKYVVMGGISSAVILYGMSFLYGMSGSTNLAVINQALAVHDPSFQALIYVSIFLLLAGFGFKIAAAPFHAWAPDVYQGAPMPVTAFLAVVSKAAGFAIMFRVIYVIYFNHGNPFDPVIASDLFLAIAVLAAAAMIVGNFIALRQQNMKRLLAYSGIANAGYLLVPLASQFNLTHYSNFSELIFYLIAYMFMNIGVFAILTIISRSSGNEELNGFAGLYYRAPFTAVAAVALVLSLAGLPISGGFFGKLFILFGALQVHLYWLAAVMIATSVVSYYYYFGIIRQMFMRTYEGQEEIRIAPTTGITLWICSIAGLLLGLIPQVILTYLDTIFRFAQDLFMG